MTTRRERWAQYACAVLSVPESDINGCTWAANEMVKAEEKLFGPLPEVEKPPLGPSALPWLERIDKLTSERDDARSQAELLEDDVRTLEERCAQLKLERDTLQAWADGLGEQVPSVPVAELRTRAAKAVADVVYDLDDRRGLGHEWRAIDEDIREQIIAAWTDLVAEAFTAAAKPAEGDDQAEDLELAQPEAGDVDAETGEG
jgi:hypothetical protein